MSSQYKYSVPKDIIGETLVSLAKENDKIVVLSSDVSISVNIEGFRAIYPERFFEMGIAEQNTVSVAGGFAIEGYIPVYVALSIFSCGMTWSQTRQVCNSGLNVKIIGTHAGVDDGQDGAGHHATEDIAISRVIPRMTVLTPSDEYEVVAAINEMVKIDAPVYMRVAREPQPIIHRKDCEFAIGKVEVIYDEGNDFAILYEGTALKQALDGWKKACDNGKKGKLVSVRSIKPLDTDYINQLSDEVDIIVTVENHSIIGGLYSAVSECLATRRHKAIVKCLGFNDTFAESGTPEDIKEKYGLTGEAVAKAIEKCNKR